MPATVTVKEMTGAGPSYTTVSTASPARYCTADDAAPGSANPIPIPGSGDYYSYWKSHCLDLAGTFTQISNVKWYTDGTNVWTLGTGGGVFVATSTATENGCPDASYDQAEGTAGTTGETIDASHSYYAGAAGGVVAATTYVTGSKLDVDDAEHTATGKTKHVVTQVQVHDDATQGEQGDETFTLCYDEI